MSDVRRIRFAKMHGAGNDYVYVEAADVEGLGLAALARAVSHRHKGVGSDGLVVIGPSDKADFSMRMFNADGSEAAMCGNASRCIARYVTDTGMTGKSTVTLETKSGVKTISTGRDMAGRFTATVDMGLPETEPAGIPVDSPSPLATNADAEGTEYSIVAVGMGNPHGIVFCDTTPTDSLVHTAGPLLERHKVWPEGANIEFVHMLDGRTAEVRVWERGAGETQACGTGASAVCAAAFLTGRAGRSLEVRLPGGTLLTHWRETDGHLLLTGPAEWVCRGEYLYSPPADDGPRDKKTTA